MKSGVQFLILFLISVGSFLGAGTADAAVGFLQVTVPDNAGKPITVGIWYPSQAPVKSEPLGFFTQDVAINGAIAGERLPLILISHGTSGWLGSHYDTALALAEAGFVVAALTHTGDNSQDQSYAGNNINLIDRPRQLKLVTDYLLSAWTGHSHVDAQRIGIFGFSLGGFAALVEIGGTPDLSRMALLCSTKPEAPECNFIAQRHGDQLQPNSAKPVWIHDARIKAAIVAAPAVSFMFGAGGLRGVGIPVQLWRAEKDSQAPDGWNSAVVRTELGNLAEEHVVPGAEHFIFLPPCSEALAKAVPVICTDAPGINRAAFHDQFNRAIVDFFRAKLTRAKLPASASQRYRGNPVWQGGA